jgi:hypothetical protein
LLHGLSAVSEAVHYFNPSLHGQSVNLEIRKHATIPQFQSMVRTTVGTVVNSRLQ